MSPIMTKPTKWYVRPAKTQISLGIRPVWSESSLCAQWVAKDLSFLHADSEESDKTGPMPRLIWVFAGPTCQFVGFVTRRLIYMYIYIWHLFELTDMFWCLFLLKDGYKSKWLTAYYDPMMLQCALNPLISHVMRLWHFPSSVNAFFKQACTSIQWGWVSDSWLDPSSDFIVYFGIQPIPFKFGNQS